MTAIGPKRTLLVSTDSLKSTLEFGLGIRTFDFLNAA